MSYQLANAKVWDGSQWVAAAGGGTIESPPVTAGLHTWFDASSFTGAGVEDGNGVPRWANLAGGPGVRQATAASQPTLQDGVQNGLPVVEFDGVDDVIQSDQLAGIAMPADFYFVAKFGRTATAQEMLIDSVTTGGRRFFGTDGSGNWFAFGSAALTSTGGLADDNPHVFNVRYNGVSSHIRVDGSTVVSGSTGGGLADGFRFGSAIGGGSPFLGFLGELLMFTSALGTTDRDAVEAYLAAKWGL